jgi:hypothetical protein
MRRRPCSRRPLLYSAWDGKVSHFLAIIEPNWVGAIPWGRFNNIKLCNSRSSERRRWVRLTTFVRAGERRLSNMLYLASISVIPIIVAVTFHEAAHGFVVHLLGDETPWRLGRVSFNPLKHIDPVGTILLPGFLLLLHSPCRAQQSSLAPRLRSVQSSHYHGRRCRWRHPWFLRLLLSISPGQGGRALHLQTLTGQNSIGA